MKTLKAIIHSILLITTTSLLAYPQNHAPHITQNVVYRCQQHFQQWVRPTTYDEIMQMLADLELGRLERKYSPMQLEEVNEYLAILAQEGILSDELEEEMILEEDIDDLMYGEDSAFQLASSLGTDNEYVIIPAVFNGHSGYDIVQCGKISRAWKKTRKFVKKHRKAIIIGAAVVVATTVVIVAVVAASSACAAAAGAAGAAASAAGSDSRNSGSKEAPTPITDTNETPIMKAAIGEHVSSFKEFLAEDKAAQASTSSRLDDLSFGEKARELGAHLAHQAYDEVTELVQVVPQLCEEVKEIGSKLFPEDFCPPRDGSSIRPMENYENLVENGHKAIDKVFSTDQAEFFTAEARANDPMNNFAIGMLPLPIEIPTLFSNARILIRNGNIRDRANFTKVGRGLMKHGYREGSNFPKPLGNPSQVNAQGQKVLESILKHPEREYVIHESSRLGKTIDIFSPNHGARFTFEGEFIGFLEPRR